MSELSNLKNQTKLLQKEKEACQSRIAALEFDISNLMKKKNFTPSEISEYISSQQQISDLQERLKSAEAESLELRTALASQSNSLLSTINVDNSACQSIIDSNNKFTMDITQKMSEKQKLLSDTLLENASLKKTISMAEAENAKLISEVHSLKWQIENIHSTSNSQILTNTQSPKTKSKKPENEDSIEKSNKSSSEDLLKKETLIEELQNQLIEKNSQLDLAKQQISDLQIEIKAQKCVNSPPKVSSCTSLTISEYSREIEMHREELARAKKEIKRLTREKEESDSKIMLYERKLKEMELESKIRLQSLSQISEVNPIYHNEVPKSVSASNTEISTNDENPKSDIRSVKALCASLRDQNESLKEENMHLKIKANDYKEAFEKEHAKNMRPNALREEVFRLREELKTIKSPSKRSSKNDDYCEVKKRSRFNEIDNSCARRNLEMQIKKNIMRYSSDLSLKFGFFQTKIQTELDKLELKFERFETYWNQVVLFHQHPHKTYRLEPTDCSFQEEFVSALKREVKKIKALSNDYADSQNIPREKVPPPSKLISDKNTLRHFVLYRTEKPHSRNHHHH